MNGTYPILSSLLFSSDTGFPAPPASGICGHYGGFPVPSIIYSNSVGYYGYPNGYAATPMFSAPLPLASTANSIPSNPSIGTTGQDVPSRTRRQVAGVAPKRPKKSKEDLRKAATKREKIRHKGLNEMFKDLENRVCLFPHKKKTKAEILEATIAYLNDLESLAGTEARNTVDFPPISTGQPISQAPNDNGMISFQPSMIGGMGSPDCDESCTKSEHSNESDDIENDPTF